MQDRIRAGLGISHPLRSRRRLFAGFTARSRAGTAVLGIILTMNLVACGNGAGGASPPGTSAERGSGALRGGPTDWSLPPPEPTAEVGTMTGALDVDELGNARYELDLDVPRGPNGMQPEISLTYHSGAGNGLVGVGWSLSGLSAIHRCPKNLADDGVVELPRFGTDDRLCLDGNRMIPVPDESGNVGTFYALRVGNGVRVRRHGSLDSLESWFTVSTPGGDTLQFGRRSDAKVRQKSPVGSDGDGAVRISAWAQDGRVDPHGNVLQISYDAEQLDGATVEHRPRRIAYGFTGNTPSREVIFEYQPRDDVHEGYTQGAPTRLTQRLRTISTYVRSDLIRTYTLAYDNDSVTGRSLLNRVVECEAGGACKPRHAFEWSKGMTEMPESHQPGHGDWRYGTPDEMWNSVPFPLGANYDGECDPLRVETFVALEPNLILAAPGGCDPEPSDVHQEDFDWGEWYATHQRWMLWGKDGHDSYFPEDTEVPVARIEPTRQYRSLGDPNMFFASRADLQPAAVLANNDPNGDLVEAIRVSDDPDAIEGWGRNLARGFRTLIQKRTPIGIQFGEKIFTPPYHGPIVQAYYPDLDGDGLSDFVFCQLDGDPHPPLPGAPAGYWSAIESSRLELPAGRWRYAMRLPDGDAGPMISTELICDIDDQIDVLDWNGDGLQDVLVVPARFGNGNKRTPAQWGNYHALDFDLAAKSATFRDTKLPPARLQAFAKNFIVNGLKGGDLLDPESGSYIPFGVGGLGLDKAMDLNGDGLLDVLRVEMSSPDADGDGVDNLPWIRLATMAPPFDVEEVVTGLTLREWINTGAGFVDGGVYYTTLDDGEPLSIADWKRELAEFAAQGAHDTDLDGRWKLTPFSAPTQLTETTTFLRPGPALDIDLDGLQDEVDLLVVKKDDNHKPRLHWRIRPRLGDVPDQLVRVRDGLGQHVRITYTPMSDRDVYWGQFDGVENTNPQYPTTYVSSTRLLVSAIDTETSAGPLPDNDLDDVQAAGPKQLHRILRFKYYDLWMDRLGRGVIGFGYRRISEVDPETGIEQRLFIKSGKRDWDEDLRDYPRRGTPEWLVRLSRYTFQAPPVKDGPSGEERQAVHVVREENTTSVLVHADVPDGVPPRYTPYVSVSRQLTHELDDSALPCKPEVLYCGYDEVTKTPPVSGTQRVVKKVDAFANVEEERVDSVGRSLHFRRTFENRQSPWRVGLLRTEISTETLADGTESVREAAVEYDGKGEVWHEIREPNRPEYKQRKTLEYDAHGNVSAIGIADGAGNLRVATMTWDEDGVFTRSTMNQLGQEQTFTWNAGVGMVTLVKEVDGTVHERLLDGFGRTTFSRTSRNFVPLGPSTKTTYSHIVDPDDEETPWHTVATSESADGSRSETRFDAAGRVVYRRATGLGGVDRHERLAYDGFGRLVRSWVPVKVGAPWGGFTTVVYDELGRARRVTSPDGAVSHALHGGTIAPRMTWQVDAKGHWSRSFVDGDGQVISTLNGMDGWEHAYAHKTVPEELCFTYGSMGNMVRSEPCVLKDRGRDDFGSEPWTGPTGTVMGYDLLGRRTSLSDQVSGSRSYTYTGFDQVETQTDSKGQTVIHEYDELGRITARETWKDGVYQGTATWAWDSQRPGALWKTTSETGNTVETFADEAGRAGRVVYGIHGQPFTFEYGYDEHSRVASVTYPETGLDEKPITALYEYDAGKLAAVTDSGVPLWRATEADAAGQIIREEFGNGLSTVRDYSPLTGRLERVRTGRGEGFASMQDLQYDWDANGNLRARYDGVYEQLEELSTDAKNRVTGSKITRGDQTQTRTVNYDPFGNFTWRDDVGTYAYQQQRVFQTLGPSTMWFLYDGNGNVEARIPLLGNATTIEYTALNKPSVMRRGEETLAFDYDAGGDRVSRRATVAQQETIYAGGLYERETTAGDPPRVVHRYMVMAGDRAVAAIHRTSQGGTESAERTFYLHPDHLGSIDLVTGEPEGNDIVPVVERMSHGTWGLLRDPSNWLHAPGAEDKGLENSVAAVNLGYTGHMREQDMGIINMRGRTYDPLLGRFMQPDPHVQSPLDARSHNRYSYVWNMPLSATDPSGHFMSLLVSMAMGSIMTSGGFTALSMAISSGVSVGVSSGLAFLASGGSAGSAGKQGASMDNGARAPGPPPREGMRWITDNTTGRGRWAYADMGEGFARDLRNGASDRAARATKNMGLIMAAGAFLGLGAGILGTGGVLASGGAATSGGVAATSVAGTGVVGGAITSGKAAVGAALTKVTAATGGVTLVQAEIATTGAALGITSGSQYLQGLTSALDKLASNQFGGQLMNNAGLCQRTAMALIDENGAGSLLRDPFHAWTRLADGRLGEQTLAPNLKQLYNQLHLSIPEEIDKLIPYDTFEPQLYYQLYDWVDRLLELNDLAKEIRDAATVPAMDASDPDFL